MKGSGRPAAAHIAPGFIPRPDVASYSFRAMLTLVAVRAKLLERAKRNPVTNPAMFRSELLSPPKTEEAARRTAWDFSLGLRGVGGVPIKLTEMTDVLSVDIVRGFVEELRAENVLTNNGVEINPDNIRQIDENTVVITIEVLEK